MSRRMLYRCVQAETPSGDKLRLEYYLLTDDVLFDGGSLEIYGVEILLYTPQKRKPDIGRIRGVTPVGKRILTILRCLSDGAVTPACLREVMDCLLAQT